MINLKSTLKLLALAAVVGLGSCQKNDAQIDKQTYDVPVGTPTNTMSSWQELNEVPDRLTITLMRDSICALSANQQLTTWQSKLSYLLSITTDSALHARIELLYNAIDSNYFDQDLFESSEMETFMMSWENDVMNLVSPTDYMVMFYRPFHVNYLSYTIDWPAALPVYEPKAECECSAKSDYCDPWYVNNDTHCSIVDCALTEPKGCGTLWSYPCKGVCVQN